MYPPPGVQLAEGAPVDPAKGANVKKKEMCR